MKYFAVQSADLWLAAGAAAAAAGLLLTAFSLRRPGRFKAPATWLLRLAACSFLLASLAELKWRGAENARPGELRVLVDASKSMEDERELLDKVLENLRHWAQSHNVRLIPYHFDTALNQEKKIQDAVKEFSSERTAIGKSLLELEASAGADAAVLLLTDGVETEEWEPPQTKLRVHAVSFGGELAGDLAVEEIRFPSIVFARGEAPFKATLRYPTGLRQETEALVRDAETKEILWRGKLSPSGNSPEDFSFSMTAPRWVGRRSLEFEVVPYAWETARANNRFSFSADVLREKLRVLYLCGKPTPDYAFLREYLKAAHGRELVSFVILRNPEDTPPFGEAELSLIPFPAHDIFSSTLPEFDLFILQDFSLSRFGLPGAYLDNIRSFIESGGGFIFLSGESTARPGEFGSPEAPGFLGDLFHLKVSHGNGMAEAPGVLNVSGDKEPGATRPAPGAALRIMEPGLWNRLFPSLDADPEKNTAAWLKRTGPVQAFQAASWTPSGRGGTKILASIEGTGQPGTVPAIVLSETGKGRAAWMGFAGQWVWKSESSIEGTLTDIYDHFWQGLIAWVTKSDTDREAVKAVVDRQAGGIKIVLRLNSLGMEKPSETIQAELLPSRQSVILRQKNPGGGVYEGFAPSPSNFDRIAVWLGGRRMETRVETAPQKRQEQRMSLDAAYLASLVEKNNGKILSAASEWRQGMPREAGEALMAEIKQAEEERRRGMENGPRDSWPDRLLEGPWLALAAAFLLGLEWTLRRRLGLSD